MNTDIKIIKNTYRDSVSLMQMAKSILTIDGVEKCSINMATPSNITLLEETGYDLSGNTFDPNDLVVLLVSNSDEAKENAFKEVSNLLTKKKESSSKEKNIVKNTLYEVKEDNKDAGLVLISIAGDYALAEAYKAINLGMNVMLFSDNIKKEDERKLKEFADSKDKIVMGPDCGTAIVDGIPLAFANVIKKGNIGLVAASGTGLQEVTTMISNLGGGITQAIGTGGNDLSLEVSGISMLKGLDMLSSDEATDVITLISKPPAKEVLEKVLLKASEVEKDVVVCFLGGDESIFAAYKEKGVYFTKDLEEASLLSLKLIGKKALMPQTKVDISSIKKSLNSEQKYIRGLFSGGTFCYEATLLMQDKVDTLYSNTCVGNAKKLTQFDEFSKHTLIDLGDDYFTRGRPHPMIDLTLRNEQIIKEAKNKDVAVIMLDLVIGYGAHENPAKDIAPVIKKAKEEARVIGNNVIFVVHICGTEEDPQVLSKQVELIKDTGAILANSNVQAVNIALDIVGGV